MPQFLDRTAEGDKSAQAEKLKGLVEMIGGTAAPLQTGEEVEKRKRLAGPTDKDSDEEDVQPTKRRKTKKELAEEKEARKKEVKIEIEAFDTPKPQSNPDCEAKTKKANYRVVESKTCVKLNRIEKRPLEESQPWHRRSTSVG
jgi:hypothetical protein